jgi:regulatory ArsR family protein
MSRRWEAAVAVPLHQAKAELFRTLGHPARVRVLELLQQGPRAVRDLLSEIDVEASNLSQSPPAGRGAWSSTC